MLTDDYKLLTKYSKLAKNNKYFTIIDKCHPNGDINCIVKDDDYFFNIRANHFIIIDGVSESFGNAIMIIANYKGYLTNRFILVKEE